MLERCLWLARCASVVLERARIGRFVSALEIRQEWELTTPDPVRAGQLRQERRRLIQAFLDDPGYVTEGFVRVLHGAHPDVFPALMYRQYVAGPYRRHQALLRGESLAHLAGAGLFSVLSVLARLNAWVWAPLLMQTGAWIWMVLLFADIVWCTYLSAIVRALVMNVSTNRRELFNRLIDVTVEGMHWWQKPPAVALAAIVKRIGPLPHGAASTGSEARRIPA